MPIASAQPGFTLLELLVVLVVIGMAASFAGPQLWHSYEQAQERSVVQDYGAAISDLRLKALHRGRAIILSEPDRGGAIAEVRLPEGWRVEGFDALFLLPSGVTNGGTIRIISSSDHRWKLIFHPFDGRMEVKRL